MAAMDVDVTKTLSTPTDAALIKLMHADTPRVLEVMRARLQLEQLKASPGAKQRSPEWYKLREGRLTASDLAQSIGKGKFGSRSALVQKKAWPDLAPFYTSAAMRWGTMCEPVALQCYQAKHDCVGVFEFGLIPHPTMATFGASPDGITDLGVMVELKCPSRRKIEPGQVPEQYMLQIQGQLEVCDLEECDYVECNIEHIKTQAEYEAIDARDHTHFHGAIVEVRGAEEPFLYSPASAVPDATTDWVEAAIQDQDVAGIFYWRLKEINVVRVKRDRAQWATLAPQIERFWADVQAARLTEPPTKKKRALDDEPPISKFAFKDD